MSILFATLLAVAAPPTATASLEVDLTGVRSSNGLIKACLTQDRLHFPNCGKDPRAVLKTFDASSKRLIFIGLQPGNYALTLFHDANSNNKLDTILGIPREGFGFSRNPVVRFGAPRYDQVNIELRPGLSHVEVRLQYLL